MDYIRFVIEHPVKVTVGVLLIILFGLLALFSIPIQLVPNVDQPVITVTTQWTGRSPEEVEKEIVEEQEDKLKGVSNLRKMTAEAKEGEAVIELEFSIGAGMVRARQEVSDKLREVPEYPADVDEPVIAVADAASESAIAWMVLTSTDPDYDVEQLRDLAEDRIKPYLERVEGLSESNVYGGRDREVHIRVHPARMAERGITFEQLRTAVQAENVNVSAGTLRDGYRDVRVRMVGQYEGELDAIRQTIVADTDAGPVRIMDLADVELTLAKRRAFVRSRASPAIALNAIRESGSNVLQVMHGSRDGKTEGLKDRIEQVNARILAPLGHGLVLKQVYDETEYIYDAIALVRNNLFIGGSLAVLALVLFLRILRPTAIVALSIPVSVVGTFLIMAAFGRNLNVVSLAGLAFAVGMVVDNAIVVLENIDRHLAMNKPPRQAAYDGAREVWGAILASTLTTLVVFLPVLFMEEEAGQLFRDIALAICAAVALSLIVSISVIPSASARWLKVRTEPGPIAKQARELFGLARVLKLLTDLFSALIYRLVQRGAGKVMLRVGIVFFATIISLIGAAVLMPSATYLPDGNRNLTFGLMLTPPGYHIEHNQSIAYQIEDTLRPYWQAQTYADTAKLPPANVMISPRRFEPLQSPPIENYFFVTFSGTIFMGASSRDDLVVKPLTGLMTEAMNNVPDAIGFAFQPSIFGRGVSGGNAIDVEITGADIDKVRMAADVLYGKLAESFGWGGVRPDPVNFNKAGPEWQVKIDRVRAAAIGVGVAQLGLAVQALVDGVIVGDFRLGGETVDLLISRDPGYPLRPDTLGQVPIAYHDRQGQVGILPLSAVTLQTPDSSPQSIKRIEERRAVLLIVRPPDDVPLEQAIDGIRETVISLRQQRAIPPDVAVTPAGTADKLTEVREALTGKLTGDAFESLKAIATSRFFIALLVVYLLMAALFESFLYPLVIMFTVPLATVGGFLGLAIVHVFTALDPLVPTQQLDVLTMLGFVILIGVVVNNAILVVHQALNFMRGFGETESDKREPMDHRTAIRESVRSRIRPIFMTTMTSICGMLPLVLMPGNGSELYRGLGSVMVGGLLVATLFTLIVVPLLLSLVIDIKHVVSRSSAEGA